MYLFYCFDMKIKRANMCPVLLRQLAWEALRNSQLFVFLLHFTVTVCFSPPENNIPRFVA